MSEDGWSISICSCTQGPYVGARKSGTPCCCERCGFMIQEQYDAIIRDALNVQRSLDGAKEKARAWDAIDVRRHGPGGIR